MAADLTKKKSNQISLAVAQCEMFTANMDSLRAFVTDLKAQKWDSSTNGITDADFANGAIVGSNVHVDGAAYRAWVTASTNLLAWWDDASNANGNPDKKFHAMTTR